MMNLKTEHIIIGGAALALWWMNKKKDEKKVEQAATSQSPSQNSSGVYRPIDVNSALYLDVDGSVRPDGSIQSIPSKYSRMDMDNIRTLLSTMDSTLDGMWKKNLDEKLRNGYAGASVERLSRGINFALLKVGSKEQHNEMTILALYPLYYNHASQLLINGAAVTQPVFFEATASDAYGLNNPSGMHVSTYPVDLAKGVNIIDARSRVYDHRGIPAIGAVVDHLTGVVDSPDCIADNGDGVGIDYLQFQPYSRPTQLVVGSSSLMISGRATVGIRTSASIPFRSIMTALDMAHQLPENSAILLDSQRSVNAIQTANATGVTHSSHIPYSSEASGLWKQGGDPAVDPYYSLTRYMATHNLFDPNIKAPPSVANIVKAGINRIYNQDNKILAYEVGGVESNALLQAHSSLTFKTGGE